MILMPSAHEQDFLSPEEMVIVLFAYTEGTLSQKYLPSLFIISISLTNSENMLKRVCASLNDDMCSEMFTHIFNSHLNTGLYNSTCLLLKNLGAHLDASAQPLLKSAWCCCKQKDFIEFFILVFKVLPVFAVLCSCRLDMDCSHPNVIAQEILKTSIMALRFKMIWSPLLGLSKESPILVAHENEILFFPIMSFILVLHCSTLNKATKIHFLLTVLFVLDQNIQLVYPYFEVYLSLLVTMSLFHFVFVTLFLVVVLKNHPFGKYNSLDFILSLYTVYYCDLFQTTVYVVLDSVKEWITRQFFQSVLVLSKFNIGNVFYVFFSLFLTVVLFYIPAAVFTQTIRPLINHHLHYRLHYSTNHDDHD